MTRKSCTCESCVGACKNTPGKFMPGEAEKLAAHMGVDLQTLFNGYLIVSYQGALMPASTSGPTGIEGTWSNGSYRAGCKFLVNDRCSIHEFKPYECRRWLHGDDDAKSNKLLDRVQIVWNRRKNNAQIVALLDGSPRHVKEVLDERKRLLGGLQAEIVGNELRVAGDGFDEVPF